MRIKIIFASLLTLASLLTGCASIVDNGPKSVQIDSNPEGAKVTISDRDGKRVFVETTPVTLALARSSGYFEGEDYTLKFEKTGYFPYETHVQSTVDGWYFGNIIFGGVVLGMLIVDPLTGDVYTLSPRKLVCNLTPTQAQSTPGQPESAQTGTIDSCII
jgi:hypothetical protein